jgi:hypothetical protein
LCVPGLRRIKRALKRGCSPGKRSHRVRPTRALGAPSTKMLHIAETTLTGLSQPSADSCPRVHEMSASAFTRCLVVVALAAAPSATAQVMTKSPSPAQASPRQVSPMQPTSPRTTMQAVPDVQLNCAYFQRNSNGSWTQRGPVTVNGHTMDATGVIITPGTRVGGLDLAATLSRQCL